MRAAPPCRISVTRFGAWRFAVLLIAALGLASLANWALDRDEPLPPAPAFGMAVATVMLLAVTFSLLRSSPVDLRWDGQSWHLGAAAGEPVSGDVVVALDFGVWMLLRFTPSMPVSRRPKARWIPVQQRGLSAHWHGLRCAVYSPRPPPEDIGPGQ